MKRKIYTKQQIIEAYQKYGTIKSTAEFLNCSFKTLWNRMKEYNIPRNRKGPKSKYNCMIKWLAANPEVIFPRSPSKISRLTGCTVDSVKSYLYRRRKSIQRSVKSLPDLRKRKIFLTERSGLFVPTDALLCYDIYVDLYTGKLKITGKLLNKKRVVMFTTLREVRNEIEHRRR